MPKFRESALAHHWLDGKIGIEIGGSAHNDFNIAGCKNVDYTDDMNTIYKLEEFNLCGEKRKVDVIAYAHNLPFDDNSLDYVLSSHVLEHVFDTIGCINEWLRVLVPGGLIYAVIPHKERTFDKDRSRTTLAEIIGRHDGSIKMKGNSDQHWLVWITDDMIEFCKYMKLDLIDYLNIDDKVGNGLVAVIRK